MAAQPDWHGTTRESKDLNEVLNRNCVCEFNEAGERTKTCQPHLMLIQDQRALDGLVFMRRSAAQLRREEFTAPRRKERGNPQVGN